MDQKQIEEIVRSVMASMGQTAPAPSEAKCATTNCAAPVTSESCALDLGSAEAKAWIGVENPHRADVLTELRRSTVARVCTGRAGPRPRTQALLRFLADHSRSKDTVLKEVPEEWVKAQGLLEVRSEISDKNLYLTRPDMGRRLCAEAVEALKAQCVANPDVQVVISDGLSTDAITVNYEEILPPLMAGLKQAGLKVGTANLHHLYHEPLPENLKLTPKVEVDNVHQRQTTDVYEHALTITAWQQIYDQLHPGKFHGEFTEILLDDIQVFREYTGLALRQSCLVWPNSFWFGIPATRGEQGFIGSQCLGSAEIATRPGGTEFELSTPDDYTILGVVLSEDVITRQANFLHNPDRVLHMLRSQSALEVKEQHKAALWGFVQQALATFCENPENLHQPAVRKVLGDNLLMAMGAMLEDAQPMVTAESISHQSYRRLLSRAREYVLENMSEPVTVLDLCNQLHVSRRTLQNAFHAILGIGPNAWLKRIRLNAVRRELISPWSQSTTVKDAAMQWGFWHLGQFATDYQQLFAEKPSLTLHQRMREWG